MAKYKITIDRENCISCGACVNACPDNWEMKDDGKAAPKNTELNSLGCNKDAAEQCPVSIIHIKDTETGEEII